MTLEIALIRHGQIYEDNEKKLIGMTDIPLGEEGKRNVRKQKAAGLYPEAALVFSSGISRCFETAKIIYPDIPLVVTNELRAPDYGPFEGMLHSDLAKDERFGRWASAVDATPCLRAEDLYALVERSAAAFRKICDELAVKGLEQAAVVSHKIVIQAILQRYFVPRSKYVSWEVLPGGGYLLKYDTLSADIEIARKF